MSGSLACNFFFFLSNLGGCFSSFSTLRFSLKDLFDNLRCLPRKTKKQNPDFLTCNLCIDLEIEAKFYSD